MGKNNAVATFLRGRRSPATIEQIAEGACVSESAARNYVTEQNRISRWVKDNESVVVLHGVGSNQYCVRSASELKNTIRVGRSSWSFTDQDGYKAHYTQ